MKKSIIISALTLLSAIFLVRATQPITPQIVTAVFTIDVDNSQLGGMTTNQYLTNYTVCFYSSISASAQPSNYVFMSSAPAVQFLFQGPAGSDWTNQLPTDTQTRFYLMNLTNQNGGVGPFSPVAVWVPNSLSGTLRLRK